MAHRSVATALALLAGCQIMVTAIPQASCYFRGKQVITEYRNGLSWQCAPTPLEHAGTLGEIGECRIPVFEVSMRCSSADR